MRYVHEVNEINGPENRVRDREQTGRFVSFRYVPPRLSFVNLTKTRQATRVKKHNRVISWFGVADGESWLDDLNFYVKKRLLKGQDLRKLCTGAALHTSIAMKDLSKKHDWPSPN